MHPQMLSDESTRLNLPRSAISLPKPAPLDPPESTLMTPGGGETLGRRRRDWIASLMGGALGPLGESRHVRYRDPVLALVHRITHGFTLAEYERARALGFEGYLEEQLDHLSIDDSAMDPVLARFPAIEMSPKELLDNYPTRPDILQGALKVALIARATSSRRQLFERMCEFWIDHFNIDHNKGPAAYTLPEHERLVIRRHALGSFPDMLKACAFSGAMLYYLDNWLNVKSAPQNNYARELLELHTLSVHGGYHNGDVDEVAKCFTGWTLVGDASSPDWLRGVFDPTLHTHGQKLVLGHVIGGTPRFARPGQPEPRDEALAVLEILGAHPSTAEFLARKLISRFLNPTPPQHLVEKVAERYLATGGDIKAMLRAILTRENLSEHSKVLGPKYRRPFHLVISAFRALDGTIKGNAFSTLDLLAGMGHSPYDYEPPTGYPDGFRDWGGLLIPRWTFSATVFRYGVTMPGLAFITGADLQAKLEIHVPSDRPGLAQRMNERLFGERLSRREVEILQEFIDTYPDDFDLFALYDSMALASSLPGFQWY